MSTARNFQPLSATFVLACSLSVGFISACSQQEEEQVQEKATFIEAARVALGGSQSEGIEFTASGWDACLGQAWLVTEGWPAWELTDYRRVIDYENAASSHNAMRRAGMNPEKIGGCGAQPGASPTPQQSFIDTNTAWADQLVMWMTPQGFLTLMESGEPSIMNNGDGWQVTLPLERDSINYSFEGSFNEEHELESIKTWIDNSVYGDMEVLTEFGNYRDYSGLSFPETIDMKQGGFTTLYLAIDSAAVHNDDLESPAPARPRPPAAATDAPAFEEIGEGIYAFHGGYQAVAVEFDDFSVVIDGLQSDSRVQELIGLVKEAIPGKPIRYVVSTHSHFDHASGLRQFAAEGATILTHADNVAFFEETLSAPRTLRTEATEPDEVEVSIQGVDGDYVISDGSVQTVELHTLGQNAHAADWLIAYLPSIQTIVEADMLQPWINPIFAGSGDGAHPFLIHLGQELEKSGLAYEHFVPIHVPANPPMMERSDLEAALSAP